MTDVAYGAERVHTKDGCVYVIRDVWEHGEPGKRKLLRCEYKVPGGPHGRWLPCREGVSFSEIQPYEYQMPARDWVV
jgi:hypothetical protein